MEKDPSKILDINNILTNIKQDFWSVTSMGSAKDLTGESRLDVSARLGIDRNVTCMIGKLMVTRLSNLMDEFKKVWFSYKVIILLRQRRI
ncbi:hypothetical protein Glove_365g145 [Diversispora epigaea]|uniref:Uncharacterized protein n=1 Tax=Diversispora epigaea TaxID=1348612 RepID=A0A397H7R5_9GLOM|nr:hypothetical protein Glove_365g145 [Diversispora epigaea]